MSSDPSTQSDERTTRTAASPVAETRTRGPDRYVGERPEPAAMTTPETHAAPCRACSEPIDPDADRCPHCGYDPSPGIFATLAYLLAVPWAVLFGALAVGSVLLAFGTELTVGGAIGGVIGASVMGAPSWWYVRRYRRRRRQGAAEGS